MRSPFIFDAVFIRAPAILSIGNNVNVLATIPSTPSASSSPGFSAQASFFISILRGRSIDIDLDRHARTQMGGVIAGDLNPHRNALGNFHKVAGGIIR